jgi:hypothetical protein
LLERVHPGWDRAWDAMPREINWLLSAEPTGTFTDENLPSHLSFYGLGNEHKCRRKWPEPKT